MSPYARNALAIRYGQVALYASLHTANPGTTGASEASGVTRKALTWTPDGSGVTVSNRAVFAVPAGTEIAYIGIFDALTGGNFIDSVASAASYPDAGDYPIKLTFTQGN